MPEIQKLVDQIEANAIVLPEFQREFVWKKNQCKELMNSLYQGFPIGSLLVWETENPPEIKNDAVDHTVHKLFQVLLDGQQRLTVLYLLLKGEVPPYYDENELRTDPRSLFFNVRKGEFHFENKPVREDPEWVKLTDIYREDLGGTDIVRHMEDEFVQETGEEKFDLADLYDKQLKKIHKIPNRQLPVESLPKTADIHEAIDLFDRINSQGTHLTDAELALAHMGAEWPHIRRRMKEKQKELRKRGFDFDLNFYVKAMVSVVTESMTYERIYDVPEEELKSSWNKLARTNGVFDFLFDVLEHEGHIPDSSYITTRDALIPFLTHIFRQDCHLEEEEKNAFLQWLYLAMMWRRYGGSADTTIESDLSLLETDHPTRELLNEIQTDRGRLTVEASDLDRSTMRSKQYYNMVRIAIRANNPVDWATGQPLQGTYDLESHHIFPKSILYNHTYDGMNNDDKKLVNEIANRAFLTPGSNREFGDKPPSEYLPDVRERNPSALENQFIPENEELWKLEHYEEFLKRRRVLLAEAINEFVENIVTGEPSDRGEMTLEDLLSRGENERVEFKETLLWDVHREQPNKNLKSAVAREVCAFANKEGGTVVIGVNDQKEVLGLDRDLKILQNGFDDFELQLNQELRDRLGNVFASVYTEVEFRDWNGKKLALVNVEESSDPIYYEANDEKEFIVRQGSSSIPLDVEEAHAYQEENF